MLSVPVISEEFQWKGRRRQGPGRDRNEQGRIVVRRRPVTRQGSALRAAMDEGPFPVPAAPDGERLHQTAAVRLSVTWLIVKVDAVQTVRAVVTVIGADAARSDRATAAATIERARNGIKSALFMTISVEANLAPPLLARV